MNTAANTAFRSTHNAEMARNESFQAIAGTLTGKRRQVYDIILRFGPLSNEEIAKKLSWSVQSVCGRVLELRGWLYDLDLRKSVLHDDKVYVEFDSYVSYTADKKPIKKSGCRWRIANIQPELSFE